MDCAAFCITLSLCHQARDWRKQDPFVLLHTAFAVNTHKYIYCTCTFSLTPSPSLHHPPPSLPPCHIGHFSPHHGHLPLNLPLTTSHPHPSPPPLTTSPPPTGVWTLPGYVSLWSECTSISTATVFCICFAVVFMRAYVCSCVSVCACMRVCTPPD